MAFKRNKYPMHKGTASHAKMVSSFKQVMTEQEMAAASIREARENKQREQDSMRSEEAADRSKVSNDAADHVNQDGLRLSSYSIPDVRAMLEDGSLDEENWSNLSQEQINKLSSSVQNRNGLNSLPVKMQKHLSEILESRQRISEVKPKGGIVAFEGDYFKEKGITEPTDVEYRVMQRAYESQK